MKRAFRVLSMMLVTVLVAQLCMPLAFAATSDYDLVLLDQYEADHYEMAAYQQGDTFYVITVLDNGDIELAFAEKEQLARTLWIGSQDVMPTAQFAPVKIGADNLNFARTVIDYGEQHQAQSEVVDIEVYPTSATNGIQAYGGKGTDDYNSLIRQLEDIHGPEHVDYDWTGMWANVVGGLTYNYKEILDYDMIYRDSFSFSVGTTLGGLIATVAAFIPGLSVPMAIISGVLGVAALYNTVLEHSGVLASYYGSAVYCRYVLVEGRGPYYECFKTTDYNGWVEEGNYYSAALEDIGTRYSSTQEIFESYTMQRVRAFENYGR